MKQSNFLDYSEKSKTFILQDPKHTTKSTILFKTKSNVIAHILKNKTSSRELASRQ